MLFAWCARQQFRNGGSPWGRELAAVLSFGGIILWPVGVYYYVVFPDWSWMYFVDPARLPWGASVLVFLGYGITLVGGYLLGWALLRTHQEKVLYGVGGALGLAMLVFMIIYRERLWSHGTFAEYHHDLALPLRESKLGWALPATALGLGGAITLVCFTLWEQGKRFKS